MDYTALIATIAGTAMALILAHLRATIWWMMIIFVMGLAVCSAFAVLLLTFAASLMPFWHAAMLGVAAWVIWFIVLAPRTSPAGSHTA